MLYPASAFEDAMSLADNASALHSIYANTVRGNADAYVDDLAESKARIRSDPKYLALNSPLSYLGEKDIVSLSLSDPIVDTMAFG